MSVSSTIPFALTGRTGLTRSAPGRFRKTPRLRHPYRQGDLDAFCGAYSLVNAVHYLQGPLAEPDARTLLRDVLAALDRRRSLVRRLTGGCCFRDLVTVLQDVVAKRYALQWSRPFPKSRHLTLATYWAHLRHFLASDQHLVLVALYGAYDHWTLVHKATPHTLRLYDSIGLQWLSREHCTLPGGTPRRHILFPSQTLFLQVVPPSGGDASP